MMPKHQPKFLFNKDLAPSMYSGQLSLTEAIFRFLYINVQMIIVVMCAKMVYAE